MGRIQRILYKPAMASSRSRSRRPNRKPVRPAPVQARVRKQADGYRTARRQHALEISEDYVELIAELIREHGEARAVDLADRLGVSHVTVTKRIRRLQKAGLVRTEPYRAIFLEPPGQALADSCRERHNLVVRFLKAIGVDDETARIDAEGIEHHVSQATLRAMGDLVRRSESRSDTRT
jgi:DtxR family manganese transport transcriptional regulator